MDDSGCEAAHSQAAKFLRHFRRDVSHFAHRFHQSAIKDARPVTLLEARSDAIGCEPPGLIAECNQIFVEIWVHLLASL